MLNRRTFASGLACSATSLLWPSTSRPDAGSLELVLLFDASGSMYSAQTLFSGEFLYHADIQREGHIRALNDELVVQNLLAWQPRVRVLSWSGQYHTPVEHCAQTVTQPADILVIQQHLQERTPKTQLGDGTTDHSTPLLHLIHNRGPVLRRVIDLSSDEAIKGEISKPTCALSRSKLHALGDTINVLAIDSSIEKEVLKSLVRYAMTPDGFNVHITDWADYTEAIRKKIILDLVSLTSPFA